jgi:hypothetical protein
MCMPQPRRARARVRARARNNQDVRSESLENFGQGIQQVD